MISGKNLLLNVAPQTTTTINASTNSPDDVLAFMLTGADEKKDEGTDLSTVDPSSFVLLLSQLFTPTPQNPAANEESVASDAQNALISGLTSPGVNPQLNENQQPIDPANLLATQTDVDPNLQEIDPENPALNWLESENFKTLKAAGEKNPLPIDSANRNPTGKVTPELNTAMTTVQTSAVVDAPIATTKDNTQNPALSLRELNASLNLDTVSAALVGAKPDSKVQDLINPATNAIPMPVVTNQPEQIAASQKTLEIPVPVNHPQWGDKFADHIAWLGNNDIKSAVIKIHPEELGPIEINVKVVKDVASVNIISHSAQVRDLMDQAIPKLRDMMNAQGLNLSEVQISADQRSGNTFAQNNNNQQQSDETAVYSDSDEEVQMVSSVKKPPKGLVDYFA